MEFVLEPTRITKELILRKVSEETLMEHYLGIPVKKGLFRSPLRKDNTPTASFYRNSRGDLIFKDFSGHFQGSAIDVVMYKFQCSYSKALHIIANDFGIISRPSFTKNKSLIPEYSNVKFEEKGQAAIQVELKEYTEKELNWWAKYGITPEILKKFKVFSLKNVFLNGVLFHLGNTTQKVFGYYGGIREELERWRVYFPGRKKYKFISNWKSFRLQGSHMLPKQGGDYLVVTKSLKDVMTLYSCGIYAIAPISENCFVTEAQYQKLQNKFKKIILFYDNDTPGMRAMAKIRRNFPKVIPIMIPKEYHAKDISDFYKLYGRTKTLELIEKARQSIEGKEKT